ncbi:MAG: hypothetical protein H0U60_02215, partial [Blastocatellia bacterium]|nr:hypothetical protein [Blastocatellia bacterium]
MKIGFAIISHHEPEQLLRLVQTINAMFGVPPIACHHNFALSSLNKALFPPNVRFVLPHEMTRLGHITVFNAALSALSLLRNKDRPDWYILLSGSDYPARPADQIISDLSNSNYDAFLDNREILYNALSSG